MYVCICRAVTESAVRRAGESGAVDADALIERFGFDDRALCCGRCQDRIDDFVELAIEGLSAEVSPLASARRAFLRGAPA